MNDLIDGLWDAVQRAPGAPDYLIAQRRPEWFVLHADTRAQTGLPLPTRREAIDYAESRQRADDGMTTELDRARDRVRELEAAIEPFREDAVFVAATYDPDGDGTLICGRITVGALRGIARVLPERP